MAEFIIVGVQAVLDRFAAEGGLMDERIAQGAMTGAYAIQRAAKLNLEPHHYRGTAEQQTTVVGPTISAGSVSVTVGIHGSLAPEGRPLEFGWSSAGKQPPTAAIAEWLTSKPELIPSRNVTRSRAGFIRRKGTIAAIASESAVRGMAFVIARNIKRRGFSFGELHWLSKAAEEQTQTVIDALTEACAV